MAELNKYIATACKGQTDAKPPRGPRGQRGGGAHKFIQKVQTGAGTRYIYAKTTQPTKFKFVGKPGGRKQPTTKFQRKKPGGRR